MPARLLISWPDNQSLELKTGSPAWREVLRHKDLIVLDLHEAALYSGHVYVENFLRDAEAFAAEPAVAP